MEKRNILKIVLIICPLLLSTSLNTKFDYTGLNLTSILSSILGVVSYYISINLMELSQCQGQL